MASGLGLHYLPKSNQGFPDSHSDKNSAAINNHYLDFVQTRELVSLVNDKSREQQLYEILMLWFNLNKWSNDETNN